MYRILLVLLWFTTACKGKLYRMPSSSMAETIRAGEPFYVKSARSFHRDDLVVFSIYSDDYAAGPDESGQFRKHWEERCYRLVALSGDTLSIQNDTVYINRQAVPFPAGCKLLYHLYSPDVIQDPVIEENIDMAGSGVNPAEKGFITQVSLSRAQLDDIRKRFPAIKRAEHYIPDDPLSDTFYAKPDPALGWNSGNYGPLIIPRPGDTIAVTEKNYRLYRHVPGVHIGRFRLEETLYFVMGDNRYFAQDSRYTGFIPHSNMRGIVK